MAYRVTWAASAESDLAAIWLSSRSRHRLSEVMEDLEEGLRLHPHIVGESRRGNLRIVINELFACDFEVDEESQIVLVLSIRKHN